MPTVSRLPGLRDLTVDQRRTRVARARGIDEDALRPLDPDQGLGLDLANVMIENTIGVIGIPMGIASNFTVNGRDYLVPMAIEEPSVVAAASNAARIARGAGGFRTSATGPIMCAQIQLVGITAPQEARTRLLEHREEILAMANEQDPMLVKLGGGALDLTVRVLPTRTEVQVIVHLVVDVRDAMGANAVNTMAEAVAPRLAEIAAGTFILRILSNKADRRLVRARATFPVDALGGPEIARNIVHASAFADSDPYRAATHNKGIMNGISAVVLATGNDTRAVEAGCHSHAADNGEYRALSTFEASADGDVVGTLEVPLAVGLVGGATRAHPAAKAAIELLGVTSATELGEVIAAVGLAQNFAACRALAAEGIQRGHMTLHARTVAASAGAVGEEVTRVAKSLVADGVIQVEQARAALDHIRAETTSGV